MNRQLTSTLTQLLVPLLSWSLVFAQQAMPPLPGTPQPYTPIPPQAAPRESHPVFTQPELDQMLAPIALYPDALLSQILMASTYPLEVIEAARWSKANPNLKGEQAVQAVAQNTWDPSVKSLVAFPQVLTMMDEKLAWMERLGEAFLAQQPEVMDRVQYLRQKATEAGHLSSNDKIRVDQQGQAIVIEPVNPEIVYVPYYDPMVIYGSWWWSAYPPVYWGPWPGYFYGPGFGIGFGWGIGIGIGVGFFYGGFNWSHHYASFAGGGAWAHDPGHRRGVPYRNEALRQQFGRMGGSPGARSEFRGHEPSSGGFGNRAEVRGGSPGPANETGGNRSNLGGASSRPNEPSAAGSHGETQPHAFEGVSHGSAERDFSARGQSSSQGFASHSFGGFHGGGGGSHHR